jgi:uncharacterized phage-associated protein
MISVSTVAKYLLTFNDPEEGEAITHLKLQKLLYYSQGINLALTGKPLFAEDIKAWKHGPVVESIYHEYKDFGSNGIPAPCDFDFTQISSEQQDILKEVYTVYGQFSAWKLRQMTHDEPPWKNTPLNEVISKESLKEYFKTQIVY